LNLSKDLGADMEEAMETGDIFLGTVVAVLTIVGISVTINLLKFLWRSFAAQVGSTIYP
jgi:hypothetical protein